MEQETIVKQFFIWKIGGQIVNFVYICAVIYFAFWCLEKFGVLALLGVS